jgi:hypothetical protein
MTSARDELGNLLRSTLHCPNCPPSLAAVMPGPLQSENGESTLRIVAYRQRSIRIECRRCGLRFSIDPANFADVRARAEVPPPEMLQGMIEDKARSVMATNPGVEYLTALLVAKDSVQRFVDHQRDQVLNLHREGVKAAKPRRGQIRFPKRRQLDPS